MKASEKDRLYRILENKICERIFRGEYADGENLPPERTLADFLTPTMPVESVAVTDVPLLIADLGIQACQAPQ